MAVKVRLMRMGKRHKPFYRMVVADERAPRDGAFIEKVGTYNPLTKPKEIKIKMDRVDYWLSKGVKASKTVSDLIKKFKATEVSAQ